MKNKRTQTRTVIGGAAGLAILLATAGCSAGNSDSDELHILMYQDTLSVVQQAAIDRFNLTSEIQVVLDEVPGSGYQDKLRTSMSSSSQPDIFFNWGGGSIRDYVDADQLLPLDDAISADPQLGSAFIPSILDAGKIDNVQYGIPLRGTQPVMLFINTNVFADIGAQAPTSWDDVLDLIPRFVEVGVTPFALSGKDAWTELMWVSYLVDRIGGPEVFDRIAAGDSDGWNDPAVLQAAETVKDLVDAGAFGDNFASVSYTEGGAPSLFNQGRAAMHLMGSWEYSTQLAQAPEFAETGMDWVTFPTIPGGVGDAANVVGNPTNYFSVSKSTKHPEAAIAFLKELYTDDYVTDAIANGEVPTVLSAKDKLGESSNPEFAEFQFDMVEKAPAFQLSWDQALKPSVATPMLVEIQKLFNGQITPQEFVDLLAALS